MNLPTTRREFTVLQYSTTLSSLITSFCVIFDICYMMKQQCCIYSRILRVLISVCCMEFIHYKTWITALQSSNTITSLITSFCFIFDNWYMMNQQYCIYSRNSKYWYQYAVLNLTTTRREFTVLQYSTTLSSLITSFCVIFDICYMMKQQCCIYSRILQVLISVCCMEFIHYKTWITALQSSNTITSLITSFCFIFDNWYMMNQQYCIYSRNSKYWYQYAVLNLTTTRREYTVLQYSTTLSSLITSFCIIFDICYMMNQQYYIYSRILRYWY